MGARLGTNTYSQGIIHDPIFVSIGSDSVVGQSALIIPHVIERDHLAHYPVTIGDRVTIGANAVVLSDVVIEDNAMIAAGAVVTKGTRIGPGEVWGGGSSETGSSSFSVVTVAQLPTQLRLTKMTGVSG